MWLEIQIFGFRALWSPYFLLFLISIALIYFILTGPKRHIFGDVSKPTLREQLSFYFAIILIYVVKGSPVDLMSHIMMTAHMIQMSILYFVVPIFIIRGLPNWLWEKVIELPVVKPIFRLFTHPIIALILFNSLFAFYHIPAIFDFSKDTKLIHASIITFLFILVIFMWWPIVTPLKAHNKMNPLLKMGYLLASMFIVSIACALMIFASKPLYVTYTSEGAWMQALSLCVPADVLSGISGSLSGPELFSPLTTQQDQQLGGIVMMFLQQIFYGIVIARIFFSWFSKKNMEVDPMPDSLPYQK